MTPKALSPEELKHALTMGSIPALLAHIAALEESVRDVDEARRRVAVAGSDLLMGFNERGDRIAALEADNAALLDLLRVNARAVPCPRCLGLDSSTCARCKNGVIGHHVPKVTAALASNRPGAALLERHEKEVAAWHENVETVEGERDAEKALRIEAQAESARHLRTITALMGDEHRKALARARNEGLEKAAMEARSAAECKCGAWESCTCNWEAKLDSLEDDLLALKEPEQ